MVQYKISKSEVDTKGTEKVIEKTIEDISFTKRKGLYLSFLAQTIADNHYCISYGEKLFGKQQRTIGFIGLESDVEICEQLFRYAYKIISDDSKGIAKKYNYLEQKYITKMCEDYGFGFAYGLNRAYEKQTKQNEWGLVVQTPPSVTDYANQYKQADGLYDKYSITNSSFYDGYEEGKKFGNQKRLKAESK